MNRNEKLVKKFKNEQVQLSEEELEDVAGGKWKRFVAAILTGGASEVFIRGPYKTGRHPKIKKK